MWKYKVVYYEPKLDGSIDEVLGIDKERFIDGRLSLENMIAMARAYDISELFAIYKGNFIIYRSW